MSLNNSSSITIAEKSGSMSLNDSSAITIAEKSSFTTSICEINESSLNLNNNVEFSKLDISEINGNSTGNLSVTLEQHEHNLLKHPEKLLGNGTPTLDFINEAAEERSDTEITNGQIITEEAVEEQLLQTTINTLEVQEEEEAIAPVKCNSLAEQSNTTLETQHTHTTTAQTCPDNSQSIVPSENEYFQQALVELGRRLWPSAATEQQYTKGCLWSPDGTCILVPVHLDGMHVIELPADLYSRNAVSPTEQRMVNALPSAVHVKEGGTVYDFVWYPFMQSNAPETCCWLATRQHEPIHMWDAFSGELRCSYRGYDDVDEVESSISLCFSNDGQKVYGGYKKSIKVFDTNVPGRNCFTLPVKQAISCFALTADSEQTITAGTWNGYIHHYDCRAPKLGALFTLGGHSGGVTWMRYAASSAGDWLLFSGARKDNKILQWDMRNYSKPLQHFGRKVTTNQRIYFDLSTQQQWMASGNTDGMLSIWNLLDRKRNIELPLHSDCCNGVNFHPTMPILATTSGQYHFIDVTHEEETPPLAASAEERVVNYENALLLLWCGRNEL